MIIAVPIIRSAEYSAFINHAHCLAKIGNFTTYNWKKKLLVEIVVRDIVEPSIQAFLKL